MTSEYLTQWRIDNPEKVKAIVHRCYEKYKDEPSHKAKREAAKKEWKKNNPDKVKAERARWYQKNKEQKMATKQLAIDLSD